MDSPNSAPTDEFWAFNPQQPPPVAGGGGDDTSLDELLALYQTAQDAPGGQAPFAPMGEPDSYPGFPAFGGDAGGSDFNFGDPATDQPFGAPAGNDFDQAAGHDPFGGFGTPAADPFGAPAGGHDAFGAPAGDAFGGFDAPHGDAFGAPAADPFGAPGDALAADFGAPHPGGFDTPHNDAFGAPHGDAFGAPGGFDAPPADAFGAPAADPFGAPGADPFDFGAADPFGGMPSAHPEGELSFGGDAGALPDLAPHVPGDAFGMDPAATSFGFDGPGAGPFGAPAADAFGGTDPFGGADPFAQPPAGAGDGLEDLFGGDAGPVFEAFDDTPPAHAAAAHAPAQEEELEEFVPDDDAPLFPAMEGAPVFEAFDPTPPAHAAAAPLDDLFGGDAGPVFEPFDDSPPAHAAAAHAAAPEDDLFAVPSGPVFEAFDPTPPAHEAAAPHEDLFGGDAGPVFEPFDDTPPAFAAPTPEPAPLREPVAAAPEAAPLPPVEEVTARPQAAPAAPMDPGALAALTGQEVVVRTVDGRQTANARLSQMMASMTGQLDDLQAKLANLYAELQRAAVRRATVGEINGISAELERTRALLGEGSDVHKQALYMRQVADAYLQLLQEL